MSMMQSPSRFFNRELSWLAFNARVLSEATNAENPLLERLRFAAISASNIEEFFMVRVAALRGQKNANIAAKSQDGLTADEQLIVVSEKANDQINALRHVVDDLLPQLAKEGIFILEPSQLTDGDKDFLNHFFEHDVYPVLTPIAITGTRRFPFIPNKSLSLFWECVRIDSDEKIYTIITLPSQLPRFIRLPAPASEARYIPLEWLVTHYADRICPGLSLLGSGQFRVLRDSEVELDDDADDIISTFRSALRRRRHGHIIRLIFSSTMPMAMAKLLANQLQVSAEDIWSFNNLLGISDLQKLISPDRPDLQFPAITPRFPERIRDFGGDCFAAIRHKDIVVHHPYESFEVVVEFLRQAASDPQVIAIKQTLYRTSNDSPVVAALIKAAELGKNVTAMIELKARFDEEANLRWARDLELAGVRVIFGYPELKTHAKISLVVRREGESTRSYVHYGTGNYHPLTAKIYTDLSFFSCDTVLCHDAARIFNYMTGTTTLNGLEKISAAPINLRSNLLALIDNEIAVARSHQPAAIWLKLNSLLDAEMIDALYRASQAGVKIHAIIRGICALRPGVPGLSENITVTSLVGRYLEHARIVCFGAGYGLPSHEAKVFLTSADWMPRNLDRRIETLVPLENPTVHAQIVEQIMMANIRDNKNSWVLQPDGRYLHQIYNEANHFSAHHYFITNPSLSGRGSAIDGQGS